MKKLKTAIFCTIVISAVITAGCTKHSAKDKLCTFMLTDGYCAEFDFTLMRDGTETISGSAKAFKGEKTKLEFISPELFSSLSVESDEKSDVGTLMFNYYGMRAPLPDGSLSGINLLLSFFSDGVGMKVSSLPEKAVAKQTDDDGKTVYSCAFSLDDGTECTVFFDKASGFPSRYTAAKDGFCIVMDFKETVPPDTCDDGQSQQQ